MFAQALTEPRPFLFVAVVFTVFVIGCAVNAVIQWRNHR